VPSTTCRWASARTSRRGQFGLKRPAGRRQKTALINPADVSRRAWIEAIVEVEEQGDRKVLRGRHARGRRSSTRLKRGPRLAGPGSLVPMLCVSGQKRRPACRSLLEAFCPCRALPATAIVRARQKRGMEEGFEIKSRIPPGPLVAPSRSGTRIDPFRARRSAISGVFSGTMKDGVTTVSAETANTQRAEARAALHRASRQNDAGRIGRAGRSRGG